MQDRNDNAGQASSHHISFTLNAQPQRGEHCPWWCSNAEPDHLTEYDSAEVGDDQVLYRIHTRYFGDHDLAITQDEKNDHGVTSMLPAALRIYGEPRNANEARRYSEWIEQASELLDRIESTEALPDAPQCTWWCTRQHKKGHGWDLIDRLSNGVEAAVWCTRTVPIADLADLEPSVEVRRLTSVDTANGNSLQVDPVQIRVGPLVELSVDQAEALVREVQTAIRVAKS